MRGHEQVDVEGQSKTENQIIFVEKERAQSNPINNVVKIWQWVEDNKNVKPVLLIQIFSPIYAKGIANTRMKQAIFLGEQAAKATNKIMYRCLRPKDWPPSKTEMDALINKLSEFIADDASN